MKPKIYIAIPTMGEMRTEILLFFLNANFNEYEVKVNVTLVGHCTENRNYLINKFLESDCEWILLLDADTVPPLGILDMVKNDKDVCSGLYFVWMKGGLYPLAMNKVGDKYNVIPTQEEPLVEVDATGGGCLLVRRKVMETLKPPFFKELQDQYGCRSKGNDFYFCEKVKEAGFKIWLDKRFISSHFKTVDLRELLRGDG
jgi:GT2 family glycosyltransferase